uniref:Uncharacterized protein n=1 Tax=Arundo donax TaxID=35708 RepID=A0A0A8Y2R2_ARUDO
MRNGTACSNPLCDLIVNDQLRSDEPYELSLVYPWYDLVDQLPRMLCSCGAGDDSSAPVPQLVLY